MWARILNEFSDSPSQTIVVRYLLENGFGVSEGGKIICNGIEIPATHVAKKTGTDRRVVDATAKRIIKNAAIRDIFLNMRVTPDLTAVADALGLTVITVYVNDAREKGIISSAVNIITKYRLAIRQIFVTDPLLSEEPKLVIIVDTAPPADLYTDLKSLPQVRKIILE